METVLLTLLALCVALAAWVGLGVVVMWAVG